MVDFQVPLPGLAKYINELTPQEKQFLAYFSAIDVGATSPAVDRYADIGPNRYRMEQTKIYRGIDNVTIHAIEHDIVLTQDIIFDYIMTGKKSPVLKLNY